MLLTRVYEFIRVWSSTRNTLGTSLRNIIEQWIIFSTNPRSLLTTQITSKVILEHNRGWRGNLSCHQSSDTVIWTAKRSFAADVFPMDITLKCYDFADDSYLIDWLVTVWYFCLVYTICLYCLLCHNYVVLLAHLLGTKYLSYLFKAVFIYGPFKLCGDSAMIGPKD